MFIKGVPFVLLLNASALAAPPDIIPVDGHDISAVLTGKKGAHSPRATPCSLHGINQNRLESSREEHWKLQLTTPPQHFDLSQNVAEARDVEALHAGVVQPLAVDSARLREETLCANAQP